LQGGQIKPDSEGYSPARKPGRLAWFGASIAAHAALLLAIVYLAPAPARRQSEYVLAYLVDVSGSRGEARSGAPNPMEGRAATDRIALAPPLMSKPHASGRREHRRSRHVPEPARELASGNSRVIPAPGVAPREYQSDNPGAGNVSDNSRRPSDGDGDAWPGGSATGGGVGGAGRGGREGASDGLAYADYGANPPPPYPARARRRGEHGTVVLRVLVDADGSVELANIAQSSGFDSLDAIALDTVRRRWRFVPARRGGTAIESWVLVPIRFMLDSARATD
jgi:periplasmic protein TonB